MLRQRYNIFRTKARNVKMEVRQVLIKNYVRNMGASKKGIKKICASRGKAVILHTI